VEPKGLMLLKGPKRSYGFMLKELDRCAEVNNCDTCSTAKQCARIFIRLCDEWDLPKRVRIEPAMPRVSDTKKYADWMPVLSRRNVIATISESHVYP